MCQVLFSESKNPPKEALIDSNAMNRDGFGYAWVENKIVHWNKGFDQEELTEEVITDYLSRPFPKAIHFRLATHGGTSQALTHPFPIKRGNPHDLQGEAKAVLFHNGIWHAYDDRLREAILSGTLNPNVLNGGMSDSRAMAVLAQRFGIDFLDLLNLGSNKVLVLAGDRYVTYGNWTEKEGWSASNSKIFRVVEPGKAGDGKVVSKGVALGPSGLPLSAEEKERLGRLGHLNRHGNLRSKFRRGGSSDDASRDMGPQAGKVDATGESARLKFDPIAAATEGALHMHPDDDEQSMIERMHQRREHAKTEQPTPGSIYLSCTMQELHALEAQWGMRERL